MRYFTQTSDPKPLGAPLGPLLTHVVDMLRLPWGSTESVVVADRRGALHLVSDRVPACLPPELRAALTQHELSGAGPTRKLHAATLYVMALDQVEQGPNTPGTDDPVELSGTLFGPFGDPGPASAVRGTLTVTRGELLTAIVAGVDEALVVPTVDGRTGRCLHLFLPGDSEAETTQGRSLVLVYPLAHAELEPPDVANEALVATVLADVLGALQADLRAAGDTGAFAKRALPVASRPDFEAALERDGWEIRGDTAVKLDPSLKKGLGGLLTTVLGVPDAMTRALPPEGTLETFVALAREALAGIPPSARMRALGAPPRVAPAPSRVPARSAPPPPPPEPTPSDWSTDFGAPRRTTDLRATAARSLPKPALKPSASPKPAAARPTWMDDFET